MDLEARARWVDYSRARGAMLEAPHIAAAPWRVVELNDERRGRISVIRHLLDPIDDEDLTPSPLALPERQPQGDFVPPDWSTLSVPDHYGRDS